MPPLKALLPSKVRVPGPACVRLPVPPMAPPNVVALGRLKDQRAVVDRAAVPASAGDEAVAHLQRAGGDCRTARVGVAAQQGQHARTASASRCRCR